MPGGKVKVTKPLRILTYDCVLFPSHKTAYIKEVNESLNFVKAYKEKNFSLMPVTENALLDYFARDSSNVDKFMESGLFSRLNEKATSITYNLFENSLLFKDYDTHTTYKIDVETQVKNKQDFLKSLSKHIDL